MSNGSAQSDRRAAEAVFDHSFSPQSPLYAVIDAARAPEGPYLANKTGASCVSLFAGDIGDKLSHVAPHLISFRANSPFRRWWFDQWGKSAGILLESTSNMKDLRRHFRTLLIVKGEGRKQYYFRFYDPRVLSVFLPACTEVELDRFFGPIRAFYCESPGGKELLSFEGEPDENAS